jgi:tRNA G18 (ribose-2'-O)-methylase SpoU
MNESDESPTRLSDRVRDDQSVSTRITDPADPRLDPYLRLTDMNLRQSREPAEGIFIAEGEKVIRRALDSGCEMRSMLLEEKWLPTLADVIAATAAPVYLTDRNVLDATTGYAVHRGALAVMSRPAPRRPESLLEGSTRLLLLEDVNDHTNVGLMVRSAGALGMDAVLLSPACADPLYRRAVKTSMGASLTVPWGRFGTWPGGLDALASAGVTVLALTPGPEATDLRALQVQPEDRVAVLVGSEGSGLRTSTLRRVPQHVRIPMGAGVDSLNVAAAAAIAMYAVGPGRRQGQPPGGQSRR